MKTIKYIYIMLSFICGLFIQSCMNDGFDDVSGNVRGNATIKEAHVMTIAQLKAKYASTLKEQYGYTQITDDIQLKAYVTGNDIEGNLFGQIALEDVTGAIIIGIGEGGVFSYLPIGTEIIVNLKDLYIGNYGYQTQIGTLYESAKGEVSVSRMARMRWDQHFNYTGKTMEIVPTEFNQSKLKEESYLAANSSKLMTLKAVTFVDGGEKVYANKADVINNNSCERGLVGLSVKDIVVRTSTYANFAADQLPSGKVNITGIFTRYGKKWQVIIRQASDVATAQ